MLRLCTEQCRFPILRLCFGPRIQKSKLLCKGLQTSLQMQMSAGHYPFLLPFRAHLTENRQGGPRTLVHTAANYIKLGLQGSLGYVQSLMLRST